MNERVERLFGIKLFSWHDYGPIDAGYIQFDNVKWNPSFNSMQKFNGMCITRNLDGWFEVYDNDGDIVYDDFLINIPEFKEMLLKQIGKEIRDGC